MQPVVVDLASVLRSIEALLARVVGRDVTLRLDLPEEPVRVDIDPSEMEQIAINLALNARDALPEGGTLIMRLTTASPDDTDERSRAVLEVEDDGCGMSAETAARAFEPFFTTKPMGSGSGLGLATVWGVAQRAGGSASVVSQEGVGSTVRIVLPLATSGQVEARASSFSRRLAKGDERILVVEDLDAVSALVGQILEIAGYQPHLCSDPIEAVRIWSDADPGHFDLVLTDVAMPGIDGPEMVRRMTALGREPRVLFMSGYAQTSLPGLDSTVGFIEKPFTAAALTSKIRDVLDG